MPLDSPAGLIGFNRWRQRELPLVIVSQCVVAALLLWQVFVNRELHEISRLQRTELCKQIQKVHAEVDCKQIMAIHE